MKLILTAIMALTLSASAKADQANLVNLFKQIQKLPKGPLGGNVEQFTKGRSPLGGTGNYGCIKVGGASGPKLFQAAYRNAVAQELVNKEDFFMGNFFTTNYYMLMGEYVFGNACSSHPIDNQAMVNQTVAAMPRAMSMLRHFTLERHYIKDVPGVRYAKDIVKRGVADGEHEQTYAKYFFSFLLNGITQDIQFLPVYLLARQSAVGDSPVLQMARDQIAALYQSLGGGDGYSGAGMLGDLYALRNQIHNTLSQDTIRHIEAFQRKYKGVGTAELNRIKANIVSYYGTSGKKIAEMAKKMKLARVEAVAQRLATTKTTVADLFELSNAVVEVRAKITDNTAYPFEKKVDALLLVSTTAQYLSKEINRMTEIDSPDAVKVIVTAAYLEGFLIKSNWERFQQQLAPLDLAASLPVLAQVSSIAVRTIAKAFEPALDQWKVVEPKMEGFVDSVIKSSALSAAGSIEKKIKK